MQDFNIRPRQGSNTKIEFIRGDISGCTGVRPQVRRNFDIGVGTPELHEMLREGTSNGMVSNQQAFQRAFSSMIRLAPPAESLTVDGTPNIQIPGGFESDRARFFLIFKETNVLSNSEELIVLTGYTNYYEASYGNHLDPNMCLYFNNVTRIKRPVAVTPTKPVGDMAAVNVESFLHSHNTRNLNTVDHSPGTKDWVARPFDVARKIALSAEVDMLGASAAQPTLSQSSLNRGPVLASSNNENPANFASNIVQAYNTAQISTVDSGDIVDSGYNTVLMKMSNELQESSLATGSVIGNFNSDIAARLRENSSITVSDLELIAPGVLNPNDTRLGFTKDPASVVEDMSLVADPELRFGLDGTEFWTSAGHHANIGELFASNLGPMMQECLLQVMNFTITNYTLDGKVEIIPVGAPLPLAQELAAAVSPNECQNRFFNRIRNEILTSVETSLGNGCLYTIKIHCHTIGKLRMTIDLHDGNGAYPYSNTPFTSALKSNMLVGSNQRLDKVSTDFHTLIDIVTNTHDGWSQPQQSGVERNGMSMPMTNQNIPSMYPQHNGMQNMAPNNNQQQPNSPIDLGFGKNFTV